MKRNLSSSWTSKIAKATTLLMIVSIMVPVLAFAQAYFLSATYDSDSGTVTASVYTDETVTGDVYLNLYNENMNVIDQVYLSAPTGTYTVGDNTYGRYDFTATVTADTYETLKLTSSYGTVTSAVYTLNSPIDRGGSSGGGGGGGGGGSGGSPSDGGADSDLVAGQNGTIDAEALKDALEENAVVTIALSGTFARIPAEALVDIPTDRIIRLMQGDISLDLPVRIFTLEALAEQLDTTVEEMFIRVSIEHAEGETLEAVQKEATSIGAKLTADPVHFRIAAEGDDERSVELTDFGSIYVSRTLPLGQFTNAADMTGVLYDAAADRFSFVPTSVVTNEEGQIVAATLKRPGNSMYAVIDRDKTFNDIKGHWAQTEIERMAGKLVIEGVNLLEFQPDRDITRAEFAALLVRSLGVSLNGSAVGKFSDVGSADWYASVVGAASDAGLINGYPDGTFGPNRSITRAEMAAMMVRALNFAGEDTDLTAAQAAAITAGYSDRDELGWAEGDFAAAIQHGIINGMTDTTLAPGENATRAQAAVMLERMLRGIGFII